MTQAHLKGGEDAPQVYVKRNPEFQSDHEELLKILLPLYALAGSGDYMRPNVFSPHQKESQNDYYGQKYLVKLQQCKQLATSNDLQACR